MTLLRPFQICHHGGASVKPTRGGVNNRAARNFKQLVSPTGGEIEGPILIERKTFTRSMRQKPIDSPASSSTIRSTPSKPARANIKAKISVKISFSSCLLPAAGDHAMAFSAFGTTAVGTSFFLPYSRARGGARLISTGP